MHPLEEVLFWIIDLDNIQNHEATNAMNLLDDEALRYSSRYKFEKDRNRSIIVHGILRYHVGKFLQQESHEIEIRRTEFGKPYIENNPIHFSLSSTQHWAFLAFHPLKSIGIDIEYIKNDIDTLKLSKLFLTNREKEWVKSSSDQTDYFFNFWCAKEAILKAQGNGFLVDSLPELEPLNRLSEGCILFKNRNLNVYVYDGVIANHKLAVCINE